MEKLKKIKREKYNGEGEKYTGVINLVWKALNKDQLVLDLEETSSRLRKKEEEMRTLEREGILDATTSMKKGGYMYLVTRQTSEAKRKRVYIGCDNTKQQIALNYIARFKEHQQVRKECENLRHRLDRLTSQIETLQNNANPDNDFRSWYAF